MAQRILLNFIMKNEAANLPRMLAAAAPHICGVACVDTGSTDDSVGIVYDFCAANKLPLALGAVPFVDFGQARNAALHEARTSSITHDYLLFLDCDHELVVNGEFPTLTDHAYALMQDNGKQRFLNIRLLRSDQTDVYQGRTHEALIPDKLPTGIHRDAMWVRDHETGPSRLNKFERDLDLLTAALEDEPDNPRTQFYMVQTHCGLQRWEEARYWADSRIALGGLKHEVYWSMVHKARCGENMQLDPAKVHYEFIQAYDYDTSRAEALYHLGAFHRRRNEFELALLFTRQAAMLPHPPHDVIVYEAEIYEWCALDDWLAVALVIGNKPDARFAAKMLATREIPVEQRKRIAENVLFVSEL